MKNLYVSLLKALLYVGCHRWDSNNGYYACMQELLLIICWIMAILAGWPNAFITEGSLFCFSENISVLVSPISL